MLMVLKRQLKKNRKKGFTLVEVIVVLVILAILAAIAIPALTGYIQKANDQALKADGRTLYGGAQAIASQLHDVALAGTPATKEQLRSASGTSTSAISGTGASTRADWLAAANHLAAANLKGKITATIDANNKIEKFAYTNNADANDNDTKWAYFDGTSWEVTIGATTPGSIGAGSF
ncbi:MAG: prepilin-type N-terminal cleavage/methylation domain-containing protein [Clostridiales Family XIII bacterium]|jgi:type IV pilus assembly protein PilA|nr:prepilin-type N-terminal cleavage/methylation domain-containing protein [Clostridiales Family XIII bacterium]